MGRSNQLYKYVILKSYLKYIKQKQLYSFISSDSANVSDHTALFQRISNREHIPANHRARGREGVGMALVNVVTLVNIQLHICGRSF